MPPKSDVSCLSAEEQPLKRADDISREIGHALCRASGAQYRQTVKANSAAEVVSALAALGANFDLASPGEIDICLGVNDPPQRLSFGNTIKRGAL